MYHSYNQHANLEDQVLSTYPVDSRVPGTYALTQFAPDVARKDFADDTITVEPMKNDREVQDTTTLSIHHAARQRLRNFNLEGFERARKILKEPEKLPLFKPTIEKLDGMPHWTTDITKIVDSHRGTYRDTARLYEAPAIWQSKYDGLPERTVQQIEFEQLARNRHATDRVFDRSGMCR
jgi:hypothetical protein